MISTSDTSVGPGLGSSVPAARVPLGKTQAGGSSESELGVCGTWLHASLTVVSRFSFLVLHKLLIILMVRKALVAFLLE